MKRDKSSPRVAPPLAAIAVCACALATPLLPASAQGLPDSRAMSCATVQQTVAKAGAIVLATGANTYDRYVRDQAYCYGGMQTKPAWVPAKDNAQCFAGYTCWDPTMQAGTR